MEVISVERERGRWVQRGLLEFYMGWWIRQHLGKNDETGHSMILTMVASAYYKREDVDA